MTVTANVLTLQKLLSSYDQRREGLISILQEVQDQNGFLSEQALSRVAEYLGLSPNEVYGVATFYAQFRFHAPGKNHMKVCVGTACHVRQSALILEALCRMLRIGPGETTADLQHSLESVACFGSCALAPVVVLNDKVFGRMTPRAAERLIEG